MAPAARTVCFWSLSARTNRSLAKLRFRLSSKIVRGWCPSLNARCRTATCRERCPNDLQLLPLCRPSHPRLDELGDFGDPVADFAALAAAGLWQVHVGSLPRTCSGLRLQKRAVLLAGGDHGGGLFNDTHRRHHGPRPKAHPPNTDAREIRDFGNTLRHHDVDRQRRE